MAETKTLGCATLAFPREEAPPVSIRLRKSRETLRETRLEVTERIHGRAVDAHFEVQVRAEAVAGAANVADGLPL
jgi:hypothetical protein